MPRKPNFKRRKTHSDAKFNDRMVGTFITRMTMKGKKSLAERLFYTSLKLISEKISDQESIEVFRKAVKNTMPVVRVRARRIGGSTYQVPMEVAPRVSEAISHRWLITAARKRSGKTFEDKLAAEIMDAAAMRGAAVAKKDETHRMAEANKAFAHYGKF